MARNPTSRFPPRNPRFAHRPEIPGPPRMALDCGPPLAGGYGRFSGPVCARNGLQDARSGRPKTRRRKLLGPPHMNSFRGPEIWPSNFPRKCIPKAIIFATVYSVGKYCFAVEIRSQSGIIWVAAVSATKVAHVPLALVSAENSQPRIQAPLRIFRNNFDFLFSGFLLIYLMRLCPAS